MAGGEPAQMIRPGDLHRSHERRLVEAAQSDPACFGDLYEHSFEVVYAYISRRIRDRSETEDLTAEVFRRALINLPRFKWTGAPFAAWLFRIASNLIADRAKRAAKNSATSAQDDLILPDSGKDSQARLEAVERQAQLFRLVAELPEDQKRVVALRFAEEKSIKEIAAEMERSEGAVKQLQFRALTNLRTKLKQNK